MNKAWKVVIVGPTGAALTGIAFGLLYTFQTKEEAEAHAESFRIAGTKVIPCDEGRNCSSQESENKANRILHSFSTEILPVGAR